MYLPGGETGFGGERCILAKNQSMKNELVFRFTSRISLSSLLTARPDHHSLASETSQHMIPSFNLSSGEKRAALDSHLP